MAKIFYIKNTDKRQELIEAEETEFSFTAQQPHGSQVEYFSPEVGFVLLTRQKPLSLASKMMQRVIACAKLSRGPPLSLREFYYTLRQTPELVKAFKGIAPDTIYASVLNALNDLEITCDIDRHKFTVGNMSKGFIYDAHSFSYSDPLKKVGFTEYIARTLEEWEIETTGNIIVVEKNATANRLVEMGLSQLINSAIVTVGGNFSRAIWFLTARYCNKKNLIFLCDADVYGDDMVRTIEFGTQNSRHLPFKFPPDRYPKIFLAGLYPSFAERLGLPNDVSEKRPMNNKFAKKRLEFLERFNLMDPRDIATWRRNKTYELEALSTFCKSTKDGSPIGAGIYLIEYMRFHNIPIKPPIPPDEELKKKFDEAAHEELKREIREATLSEDQIVSLKIKLDNEIRKYLRGIVDKIYSKYEEALEETLEQVGPDEIKYHILKQFAEEPGRKEFDYGAIAHKLKTKFDVDVLLDPERFKDAIEDLVIGFFENVAMREDEWVSDIEFSPIHNETARPNIYDIVLDKLGASIEDREKIREAIEWRFGTETSS